MSKGTSGSHLPRALQTRGRGEGLPGHKARSHCSHSASGSWRRSRSSVLTAAENQCLPCSNQATGEAGQADCCSKCHGEQGTGAVVIHKPPTPLTPPRERWPPCRSLRKTQNHPHGCQFPLGYLGCGLRMRTNSGEFTFLMWNRKDTDRGVPPTITAKEKAKAANR